MAIFEWAIKDKDGRIEPKRFQTKIESEAYRYATRNWCMCCKSIKLKRPKPKGKKRG